MTMGIKFKDVNHEEGFNKFIKKANVNEGDKERISLFYLLAIFEETRRNINDLYDFKENCMKSEGLEHGWQTGGTTKVTKLAFNLFNGYRGEDRERENYSPLELLSTCTEYMIIAVQIRFS